MDEKQLQEWADIRAIKQTKLPKKTWVKQPDGTYEAIVKLVRDANGCVTHVIPLEFAKQVDHIEDVLHMVSQKPNSTDVL